MRVQPPLTRFAATPSKHLLLFQTHTRPAEKRAFFVQIKNQLSDNPLAGLFYFYNSWPILVLNSFKKRGVST